MFTIYGFKENYINRYFWFRPNIPKFIQLITCENGTTIRNLSTYAYEGFRLRNSIIYNN